MGTSSKNFLVNFYQNRIGVPSTNDEAYGYWVFVLGVIAGFSGIALVMLSNSPGQPVRGYGIAIAALGLVLLLIGPIIRLPLKRAATLLSYLGAVVGIVGVGWFLVEYLNGNWGAAFANSEVTIIGVYGAGIFLIALGSILVPLLTSPRKDQLAAEARASEAEGERDAALEEARRRAREAEERAEEAANMRDERDQLAAELAQIRNSQSQFELFTDAAGEFRWRLRHRNHNIIADSSEGYSSRQKAQQGLSAVKRDAFGGAVVDLDKLEDIEVEAVDDAVTGENAPAFVDTVASKASFETYADASDDYRWRLRHDNGNIIADSGEGYSSSGSRDDAIDRVKQYVQSADYMRLKPAAFELYRDKADEYRWRLLHKNGNILADSGEGYASRQKARQGLDSVRSNVGDDAKADFEVYEDKGGEYRWRLIHQNGNTIADSGDGYESKDGAEDAVERFRRTAPEAHVLDIGTAVFEIYGDTAEEWRWRLRHRNGRILADSGEGYASRSGAEDGVNSIKRNAPNATVTAAES
jgi:uncharacterized protein YegP (UPF0339 family)